ncbi:hypothetical protein HK096_005491 [Nowakowskiella sp. JEL0078]|nr:hypothetical protein HK096_005491 [Nowakowskiella sp. JEL0078]
MTELSHPTFFVPESPLLRRKSSFDSSNAAATAAAAFAAAQSSDSSLVSTGVTSSFSNQYNSMLLGPHDSSFSRMNGRRPSIGTVSLFGMDIINTSMVGGQFVTEDKVDSIFNFEPPTSFEDLHVHFSLGAISEENDKELTRSALTNDTSSSSAIIGHSSKHDSPISDFINRDYSSDYQNSFIDSQNTSFPKLTSSSSKRPADFEENDYNKRSRAHELMHHNGMQNQPSIYDSKSFMHTVSPAAMHHPSTSPAVFLEDMAASAAEANPIDHRNLSNGYHNQYQNQEIPISTPRTHQLQHQYQHHLSQHPQIHQFISNETIPGMQTPVSQYSFNTHSPADLSPMPSRPQSAPIVVPNSYVHTQNGHYQYQPQYQNQQIMNGMYNHIPLHNHGQPQYAPNQQMSIMDHHHSGGTGPIMNNHQYQSRKSPNNSDSKSEPDLDNELNLDKKYKCPKPWCSKVRSERKLLIFLSLNKTFSQIYKNSNGLKYHIEHGNCELDYTSTDGAIAAAALEFDENGIPSSNRAGLPPPTDIKITHRPYWCKVRGCGKKYKNLNGLKYHGKVSHPDMDFRSMVKGHSPNAPQS